MFTIKNIAEAFGLKTNTLRYWLKKNNDDFENDIYNFNLSDLIQKIKIYKRTKTNKIGRKYEQYIVLDIDEFKIEYDKYINYVETLKKKKREGNLSWSSSAIDCYNCKMNCQNCFNKDICLNVVSYTAKEEPPMKSFVKKLLSEIGKPPI